MPCEEIEIKILNYQENHLSQAEREEVENHLAGCEGCRLFARQLQQLDAELSSKVKVPLLPPDFERRLKERIQAAPTFLSEVQRAERKRQLQAEFESGKALIRRRLFSLDGLLGHLTWAALTCLAGWLTWTFASQLTSSLHLQIPGNLGSSLLPVLAATVVFLAVGLAEAIPQLRRLPGI